MKVTNLRLHLLYLLVRLDRCVLKQSISDTPPSAGLRRLVLILFVMNRKETHIKRGWVGDMTALHKQSTARGLVTHCRIVLRSHSHRRGHPSSICKLRDVDNHHRCRRIMPKRRSRNRERAQGSSIARRESKKMLTEKCSCETVLSVRRNLTGIMGTPSRELGAP